MEQNLYDELARTKNELKAQIEDLASRVQEEHVGSHSFSNIPFSPTSARGAHTSPLKQRARSPGGSVVEQNLIDWADQTTKRVSELEHRLVSMGTAHKASEELHNLQKKDVSTIAAAIDEMRYNEVKSIATKDSERIEQLTADVKVNSLMPNCPR